MTDKTTFIEALSKSVAAGKVWRVAVKQRQHAFVYDFLATSQRGSLDKVLLAPLQEGSLEMTDKIAELEAENARLRYELERAQNNAACAGQEAGDLCNENDTLRGLAQELREALRILEDETNCLSDLSNGTQSSNSRVALANAHEALALTLADVAERMKQGQAVFEAAQAFCTGYLQLEDRFADETLKQICAMEAALRVLDGEKK